MNKTVAALLLVTVAGGYGYTFSDWYYANIDSFLRLPTNKLFYLEQKAGLTPRPTDDGESLNVRMVGKWGGGPSWGVTGKDTLVYLSRGSEVVVINFADTANPRILNYIQARRLAGRPVLVDTLLYLATSGYIEVFNVKDPTNAPRVGRLATPVSDIDVEDTLLYSISADTFRVYSFADPANPRLIGACRDSGYALDFDGGYAFLRDRWGMYILDVTNPANPHRVASWGTDIAGVKVRGKHCYVAQGQMGSNSLHVLNVASPASPWQEGVLSGTTGEDIYLVDTLLFLPGFDVVNVADSSRPRLVGHAPIGGLAVWANAELRRGYAAKDQYGMTVLDLTDMAHPVVDTELLAMGSAADMSVQGGIACVAAGSGTGLTMLDVSDPTRPVEIANLDTAGPNPGCDAVINTDSLAYLGWWGIGDPLIRVVSIDTPTAPHFVGGAVCFNPIEAMVLRDSFLYCAEDYKFEVFNVANPRQPVLRGRCNLQEASSDVVARDSLAYVTSLPSAIVNVVNPSQPQVVGTISSSAYGIAVYDTFAYLAVNYGGLEVWGIANPLSPYRIDTVTFVRGYDVEVNESLLLYGGLDFRALSLTQPAHPPEVGFYATPYRTRKLATSGNYIYCACFMAGVAVLELLPSGISDGTDHVPMMGVDARVRPNPTTGDCELVLGRDHVQVMGLYDVAGRPVVLGQVALRPGMTSRSVRLKLSGLARGAYLLRLAYGNQHAVAKIVKE